MKRFAAIVTIVVVVLGMSAGTAFASTCASPVCGPSAMVCADAGTPSCPMGITAMLRSACGHLMDRGTHDVVAPAPTVDRAAVASIGPFPVVPPAFRAVVPMVAVADARGAPHLTSVIRI